MHDTSAEQGLVEFPSASHQDWNSTCLILESSSAELMKEEGALEIRSEEQLTKNQKHKLRKKLSRRHKVVTSILHYTHYSAAEGRLIRFTSAPNCSL